MSRLVALAGGQFVGIDAVDVALDDINPYSSLVANNGFIRTSSTTEQFSNKFYYDLQPNLWTTPTNTNATFTHEAVTKTGVLTIQNTDTAAIILQTKQRFIYLPGSTIRFTAGIQYNLQDGAVYEVGVFDARNGYYFQVTRAAGVYAISVTRRSDSSGSVINESIDQAQWNIDKMDGTGPSGKTLDLTKVQMLCIEYTWYGAGGCVMGFEIDRKYYFVHWFSAGNRLTSFINGDPELPIKHNLYNTTTTAGTSTVKLGGCYIGIDGALDQRKGYRRSYVLSPINVAANNTLILLALRPKATFKGQANNVNTLLEEYEVFGTAEGYYQLVYNSTITGATWTDVNTNFSSCEVASEISTFTPGVAHSSGGFIKVSNRGGVAAKATSSKEPLVAYSDGSGVSNLAITFTVISAGTMGCVLNWSEYY